MGETVIKRADTHCTHASNPTLMDFSSLAHLVLFALVVWLLARAYRFGSRERGLPPGPPTLPVIGNLHVFPSTRAYLKYVCASPYGKIYPKLDVFPTGLQNGRGSTEISAQ